MVFTSTLLKEQGGWHYMFKLLSQLIIALVGNCKSSFLKTIQQQSIPEFFDSNVQCIETLGVQLTLTEINLLISQEHSFDSHQLNYRKELPCFNSTKLI